MVRLTDWTKLREERSNRSPAEETQVEISLQDWTKQLHQDNKDNPSHTVHRLSFTAHLGSQD
ncbi:hypothetical protein HPB48_004057 [Haemaphysalis longicornis]|uniref:Uncharacterized protein n=1 Tax=Haemaphysalis longicornis TaxID=44386 RepID=A0A9J6G288_HAELO|nr:hypothetical protein HPB48_004057 [Haemaphysalis longicornis]